MKCIKVVALTCKFKVGVTFLNIASEKVFIINNKIGQ